MQPAKAASSFRLVEQLQLVLCPLTSLSLVVAIVGFTMTIANSYFHPSILFSLVIDLVVRLMILVVVDEMKVATSSGLVLIRELTTLLASLEFAISTIGLVFAEME